MVNSIHWEVHTRTFRGIFVPYFVEDGIPKRFDNLREANEALTGFLTRTGEEIARGERLPEHGYTREEFKIVCVIDAVAANEHLAHLPSLRKPLAVIEYRGKR